MSIKTDTMFEAATRLKVRFQTVRGPQMVESLWEMPLESKDGYDLDTLAKTLNRELKALSEESFVNTKKHPAQDKLNLAFDIVKYVIVARLDEQEAAKTRADKKKERDELVAILAEKEGDEKRELSKAAVKKRIAAIDAEIS